MMVWGHRRWWEHFHNLACHTGVSWSISPQRPCAALHVLQELSPPSFHQWSFASFLCHSAGHIPGKQRGRMHHKNVSKKFCNNGENVAKRDHIQRLNIKNDQKPQLLLTTSSRNWFRFVYCKSILWYWRFFETFFSVILSRDTLSRLSRVEVGSCLLFSLLNFFARFSKQAWIFGLNYLIFMNYVRPAEDEGRWQPRGDSWCERPSGRIQQETRCLGNWEGRFDHHHGSQCSHKMLQHGNSCYYIASPYAQPRGFHLWCRQWSLTL